MTDLPNGWARVPLESLIELNPKTVAPDHAAAGFSPMQMLGTRHRDPVGFEQRTWGTIRKTYVHFRDGDVLLAKITPCFENGKAGLVRGMPNGIGAGSSEYFVCRSDPRALDPRYLLALFKTDTFLKAGETRMTGSVGHKRVPKDYLLKTEVPLAPIAEQRRIADKIDALLARVDACRERLDSVPAILKRFRQAVLEAAADGALTNEWRDSHNQSLSDWQETTLDLACVATRVITYGVVKLGEEVPGGVPCLRTSNVRWLSIETAEFKSISPDISAQYGRTILQGGEVLVNVRGTLGGVAVVPKEMRGWNVSREVAVVPVDKQRVLPAFLAYWIASQRSQRWLARVEKGVAYTGINIEDLRALPVACPPIDEQREAVRRVESLFALADSIEARWRASRSQIERLTPSLLAKAFRGELVPQDPNDEPASALLARLRSPDAREKAPLTRKLGRPQARAKAKETVA